MVSNEKTKKERKSTKKPVSKNKVQKQESLDAMSKMLYNPARDEWMLSLSVDDMGVANIQLPPDLSSLLQSETVSVSPSGGGIFIRSV